MITSWYYSCDGAKNGPVPRHDLQLALNRGEIDPETLVWCEGMPHWQPLESVEELRSLLEQVPPPLPGPPPPLPDQPPPLPDPPPPGDQGSTVDPGDRGGAGDGRGSTDRPRKPGKVKAQATQWLVQSIEWLAGKIGNHLWDKYFGKPALVFVLVPSLVVGVVVTVNHLRPKTPVSSGTGQVRIDANPWGEVRWVRGPGGNVDLPAARTTPLVLTVPAGTYQAEVDYPHAGASERCSVQVRPGQLAACWLDLAPVDADSYFQQIGW